MGRGGTGNSIYQDSDDSAAKSPHRQSVKGLLLDDIYEHAFKGGERIDLCKIDVENAEYEILSSPGDQCLKQICWLIMEIHNTSDTEKTTALLTQIKELGFVQIGRYDDVFAFENQPEIMRRGSV